MTGTLRQVSSGVLLALIVVPLACGGEGPASPAGNQPPRFLTDPPRQADHDIAYVYNIEAVDPDGDPLTFTVEGLPDWLRFDTAATLLTGTPGGSRIGEVNSVRIKAHDSQGWVTQAYDLTVVFGTSTLVYEGWWIDDLPAMYHHGHDGHPHETENFVVFSDLVPLEERAQWADTLELHLGQLMDSLGVAGNHEFAYTTPDRRLHVMLSRHQGFPRGGGGIATQSGFMLYSIDYYDPYPLWRESYSLIFRHEVMHCVETMLCDGMEVPPWWAEGIAEYVSELSGLRRHLKVTRESDLSEDLNPIAIRTWSQCRARSTECDAYGELAVRYLLDPKGHGKTWTDVRAMYRDMRGMRSFEEAFAARMEITMDDFRTRFFELMRAYLP